jgi:SAM-dependent methyltransferase
VPTIDQTRSYFDRNASDPVPGSFVNKWPAIRGMFASLPAGAHVLECGAGTGLYTIPLLRAGYRVCSVDLSDDSLRVLTQLARDLRLETKLTTIRGDFNALCGQLDDDFDAVVFIKVLHHFPDCRSIEAGIRGAYSLLKRGGRVIGFEPNGDCVLWYIWYKMFQPKETWENEKNYLLIRRSFLESVFRAIPAATWSFAYRYLIPGSLVERVPFVDPVDRFVTRIPFLRRFAANIAFVAARSDVELQK